MRWSKGELLTSRADLGYTQQHCVQLSPSSSPPSPLPIPEDIQLPGAFLGAMPLDYIPTPNLEMLQGLQKCSEQHLPEPVKKRMPSLP